VRKKVELHGDEDPASRFDGMTNNSAQARAFEKARDSGPADEA